MLDQVAALGRWTQQHPEVVWYATGALAAVGMGAALLRSRHGREQTTHGSARWATKKEVQKAGLYAKQGTVLGKYRGRILRHDGPEHTLLCGPTRSGKGVSTIIPTLLDWPESTVVLDPKDGENYDVTAAWRRQYSQVHAFTPCRQPNACINVLDAIRLGTPQAISDAQSIAQSLTAPAKLQTESGTGAHFRELATMLLTAALLHVSSVGTRPSLAGVWEFLTQQHERLGEALQTMIETAYTDVDTEAGIVGITRAIQNISGDRELSSVWTTAIRPLVLYSDPLVAASTDNLDVSLGGPAIRAWARITVLDCALTHDAGAAPSGVPRHSGRDHGSTHGP